jgi:hypothetical protein
MDEYGDLLSFIGTVSVEKTLKEHLESGLLGTQEIDRSGRTWVSQVSGCARHGALAATFKGSEVEDAAKEFYCEIGKTAENSILKGWRKDGILLFHDYSLPRIYGLDVGGKVDAIVYYRNKITVVEVKTCGALPSKPKPAHLSQARLYAAFLGLPYTLFYMSRSVAKFGGSLKVKEFNYDFDVDILTNNMYNAVYASNCIKDSKMPSKSSEATTVSHGLCTFCNFKDVCWGEQIPHLELPTNEENMELKRKSMKRAKYLMLEKNVSKRRNGVFKFLSKANDNSKRILNGKSWKDLY